MGFVHEDPDFDALLTIVADERGIARALVEKDYWVTHALWALHQTELEVWFKGGTSLSKGFGLIDRFSEDLDLRIEPGRAAGVPPVASWTSANKGRVENRKAFFVVLESAIRVPDARVVLDDIDPRARAASYRVVYPGRHLSDLGDGMRPYVLLEVGVARVTPFVVRSLSSFVHDWLDQEGRIPQFDDNRPRQVRCVHPVVSLLEKLDAISRRFRHEPLFPASFIRHYEDAASIIQRSAQLPPLECGLRALLDDMLREKQIARCPAAEDPAFGPGEGSSRRALEDAHSKIAPMFWGPRSSLEETCATIRGCLQSNVS